MRRDQLSRALGWASLGCGVMELLFARRLCLALGLPRRRAGWVRALGVREVLQGWVLLRSSFRRGRSLSTSTSRRASHPRPSLRLSLLDDREDAEHGLSPRQLSRELGLSR